MAVRAIHSGCGGGGAGGGGGVLGGNKFLKKNSLKLRMAVAKVIYFLSPSLNRYKRLLQLSERLLSPCKSTFQSLLTSTRT